MLPQAILIWQRDSQPKASGRPGAVQVAVIGAFRFSGQRSWADAQHAPKVLLIKHHVLVVAKQGLVSGPVLRVNPSLFSTDSEIDRMIDAVRAERNLFS